MKITIPSHLSDAELDVAVKSLAGQERGTTGELVAHLAELDSRPGVYAGQGYGSLFSYCTQALRLSEDAACNRIEAARACRRFPVILNSLATGEVNLTAVRLLGRHLTAENHEAVLAKAKGRSRQQIDVLLAELAPRPDVPSLVRRLPTLAAPPPAATPNHPPAGSTAEPSAGVGSSATVFAPAPRPVIRPTAPQRYRVQFTIGEETHDRLRRLQALLRREIPDGDPGAIFDRATLLLLREVEKKKLGMAAKPRPRRAIRPGTDSPTEPPRDPPQEVKRAVWPRDGGRCAYVAPGGRRCTEMTFLEFHHIQAYAHQGPPTVDNIALRCWRHNQYEAKLLFGPRRRPREASAGPRP